eukprot:ANDGO_05508.mRNA.1 Myb-related protein 3R-1
MDSRNAFYPPVAEAADPAGVFSFDVPPDMLLFPSFSHANFNVNAVSADNPGIFLSESRRVPRKHWTPEEDQRLIDAVKYVLSSSSSSLEPSSSSTTHQTWKIVAQKVGTDKDEQTCYQRYRRVLDPAISRVPWSVDEYLTLALAVRFHGPRMWSACARVLTGRTDAQCRGKWVEVSREAKSATSSGPPGVNRDAPVLIRDRDPKMAASLARIFAAERTTAPMSTNVSHGRRRLSPLLYALLHEIGLPMPDVTCSWWISRVGYEPISAEAAKLIPASVSGGESSSDLFPNRSLTGDFDEDPVVPAIDQSPVPEKDTALSDGGDSDLSDGESTAQPDYSTCEVYNGFLLHIPRQPIEKGKRSRKDKTSSRKGSTSSSSGNDPGSSGSAKVRRSLDAFAPPSSSSSSSSQAHYLDALGPDVSASTSSSTNSTHTISPVPRSASLYSVSSNSSMEYVNRYAAQKSSSLSSVESSCSGPSQEQILLQFHHQQECLHLLLTQLSDARIMQNSTFPEFANTDLPAIHFPQQLQQQHSDVPLVAVNDRARIPVNNSASSQTPATALNWVGVTGGSTLPFSATFQMQSRLSPPTLPQDLQVSQVGHQLQSQSQSQSQSQLQLQSQAPYHQKHPSHLQSQPEPVQTQYMQPQPFYSSQDPTLQQHTISSDTGRFVMPADISSLLYMSHLTNAQPVQIVGNLDNPAVASNSGLASFGAAMRLERQQLDAQEQARHVEWQELMNFAQSTTHVPSIPPPVSLDAASCTPPVATNNMSFASGLLSFAPPLSQHSSKFTPATYASQIQMQQPFPAPPNVKFNSN